MATMTVFQVPTVYCSQCGHVPLTEPGKERVHVARQVTMRCGNRRCLAFDALFRLPVIEHEVEVVGWYVDPVLAGESQQRGAYTPR